MACALEDRRFTQPMKYFLTESLLQIVYMHVCSTSAYYFLRPACDKEGAEKIVNGLRKHIEDQRMLESLRSADEPWPQQITMHNHFDHELDVCSHDRYQGKPVVKMAEIEDGAAPLSQADRDSIRNSGALLLSALVLCRSASQRC